MEESVTNVVLRSFTTRCTSNKLLTAASSLLHLQKVLISASSSSSSSLLRSSPVTVETISDNLSFMPASSAHIAASSAHLEPSRRPVVLIYAWLTVKSRHVHKFAHFYQVKGFDVLHIKVKARQILWPPLAQSVVSQIIDFVTCPSHDHQPMLIHGFSVGGYLYGETLNHIISDVSLADSMSRRVRGQVFDSPVDFEGVARGVGMALSNLRPVQIAIRSSLEAYTTVFHRQVTRHYIQSEQTFRQNPLRTPSLVLYSKADVVAPAGPIESLIAMWKSHGVLVSDRCWQDSGHVSHYRHDPVNYTSALNQFLETVGLVDPAMEQHQRQSVASQL